MEYKPKPIKGLSVKYNDKVYNNITYMSCSNEGLFFECSENENIRTNINCKMEDVEIITKSKSKE